MALDWLLDYLQVGMGGGKKKSDLHKRTLSLDAKAQHTQRNTTEYLTSLNEIRNSSHQTFFSFLCTSNLSKTFMQSSSNNNKTEGKL